jgi:hypothetical protein
MKYTKELSEAYKRIVGTSTNFPIEDFESVKLVHDYRMYFKPETVKTLLLAESHVFTTTTERNVNHNLGNILPGYPNGFVRFIYCLSYGQSHTLLSELVDKNSGTPQFWKLFNDSVPANHIITNIHTKQKLRNKIVLLDEMKANGVWLLDASIVAVYKNGKKPDSQDYKSILKESFDNYVLPVILAENPSKIVVIGKSVYDAIFSISDIEFQARNIEWIHQPNARFKDPSKRKTLNNI